MRSAATGQRLTLWVMALLVASACEPGAIAPLPSPNPPDDDLIITSSLGLQAEEGKDDLIAVVGLDGAVNTAMAVEVTNVRTGRVDTTFASKSGSFSVGALGRADDVLELRQVDAAGQRSQPVSVAIYTYEAPSFEVTADKNDAFPAVPGFSEGTDAGAGGPPDPEDPDGQATARLPVIWSFESGTLTVDAAAGFTTPGAIVIVSNTKAGTVVAAPADADGAVRIVIAASVGDEILMFSRSSANPALTTPTIRYLVSAAAGADSTEGAAPPAP
jgi:hypothetical protein